MKINEIILEDNKLNEGPLDFAKKVIGGAQGAQQGSVAAKGQGAIKQAAGAWSGAKAGYAAAASQQAGQAKQAGYAKDLTDLWQQVAAQNPTIAGDPKSLQSFLQKQITDYGISYQVPAPPAGLNPVTTAQFITKITGEALAAKALGTKAPSTTPAEPEGPKLAQGVSITSDEPIMIKFKNTDYTLNDQGQWAPATAPNKLVNQAMAKFLDNQHDIYLNSQPASPAPSPAPAATTAEPAATTSPEATPAATTTPAATAEPAAPTVSGAPVNSTVPIRSKDGIKVNFTKSADGWTGNTPGATLHKPGTKTYDSLEGEWARLNKQPAPAPTAVTSEPEVAAPVAAESFRRLNKIIR
jgi:hypothetical protein